MDNAQSQSEQARNPVVGVGAGRGAYENIRTALAAIDLSLVKGKTVLLKPNVGRMVDPRSGVNCSPESVAACVDVFREAGAARVAIGESPILGVKVFDAFDRCGVGAVAKEKDVELIDLDHVRPRVLKLPEGSIIPELRVCRPVFDFDVIVSLAVMKMHMHTGVSLTLKNVKGMLYKRQKVELHQLSGDGIGKDQRPLDVAVSDLVRGLTPHIGVIDGSIGLEGLGPSAGVPREADVAVASLDPVAADAVGCRLMGVDPETVPHIRLAAEKGVGVIDASTIQVMPGDYEKFTVEFARPPEELSLAFPDVAVYESGACSACLSTTLLFLQRYRDQIEDYKLEDGKLHVVLGKDTENVPAGTIVIGNCAAMHKGQGPFAPGCPPVASRIYKAITGREPDEPML